MKSKNHFMLIFLSFLFSPVVKPIFQLPDISPEETRFESSVVCSYSIEEYNHEKDFADIKEIFKSNWEALINNMPYDESFIESYFTEKKSGNYSPRDLTIKTVKIDGRVVGFVSYVLYDSKNHPDPEKPVPHHHIYWHNAPYDAGHIECIAIDQFYRRNGAGTLLLNYAMEDLTARGAKRIDIAVNINNIPALTCYQKLGFLIGRKYNNDHIFLVKKVQKMHEYELGRPIICPRTGFDREYAQSFKENF